MIQHWLGIWDKSDGHGTTMFIRLDIRPTYGIWKVEMKNFSKFIPILLHHLCIRLSTIDFVAIGVQAIPLVMVVLVMMLMVVVMLMMMMLVVFVVMSRWWDRKATDGIDATGRQGAIIVNVDVDVIEVTTVCLGGREG